ncbi:hypothetical protein PCASD_09336 [Puccinia coronata f. sp. avenae]|uniref:Reverse transcriptase Ty1/copia-type domain-containing protein n=1 Tax=Puccinia coronata f. sp. avenae TaxID=200324 RepID=A0A2N5USI1_9BASI|nr:hypothetical protein PCASD_09336 [Puccinia coronata f. sp. avenae]
MKQDSFDLRTFVNADWANCPNTRRSHTGFLVQRNAHLISWKSTKQATVSLSSTKAEYKALSDACKDVVWLQNLTCKILVGSQHAPTTIYVDNQGAIDLALSQISQNGFRTKHMDLRLHFVRDLIAQKLVKITYVSSNRNIADFLTKPVGRVNINRAVSTFATSAPSISALCSQAPSMSACQSVNPVTPHDADTVMRSICDELGLDAQGSNSHSQGTA